MSPRGRIVTACAVCAAATLLLPGALAYDPLNWLMWGRGLLHLQLDTRGGTAWKPLAVLLTTPMALAGPAQAALWLWATRTAALLALVGAALLAARLAGPAAGVLAALGVAVAGDGLGWFWTGTSEWLLVAAIVWSAHEAIAGRRGSALALAVAAALVRPEAWPAAVVAAWWAAGSRSQSIRWAAATAAGVLVAWLVPEWIGSGSPFAGSERALTSPGAASAHAASIPGLLVLTRFVAVVPWVVIACAVLAAALELRAGRSWAALLAVGAAAWVGEVAVMAQAGYPGIARFLAPAVAVVVILGAAGLTRSVAAAARRPAGAPAAIAIVAGFAAMTVPAASRNVEQQVAHLRASVAGQRNLTLLIHRAGGPSRVLSCGRPRASAFDVPLVAWTVERGSGGRAGRGLVLIRRRTPRGRLVPRLPAGRGLRVVASAPGWQLVARCPGRERAGHLV